MPASQFDKNVINRSQAGKRLKFLAGRFNTPVGNTGDSYIGMLPHLLGADGFQAARCDGKNRDHVSRIGT